MKMGMMAAVMGKRTRELGFLIRFRVRLLGYWVLGLANGFGFGD